jgi:hypothetical protein
MQMSTAPSFHLYQLNYMLSTYFTLTAYQRGNCVTAYTEMDTRSRQHE